MLSDANSYALGERNFVGCHYRCMAGMVSEDTHNRNVKRFVRSNEHSL